MQKAQKPTQSLYYVPALFPLSPLSQLLRQLAGAGNFLYHQVINHAQPQYSYRGPRNRQRGLYVVLDKLYPDPECTPRARRPQTEQQRRSLLSYRALFDNNLVRCRYPAAPVVLQ